jgi:colicin import membrane protein
MRLGYAISAIGHAGVLVWSMWTLAAKPLPPPIDNALPIDLVNVSEFTRMTAGTENAKGETQKPLVEQVAEAKPVDDSTAKIDQKEVKAARDTTPPPEVGPVQTKSADVKPERKSAEVKPDQIAEALAKDEPKKAEARTPMPPKKPPPPAPKFEPNRVKDLLDKRDPTRVAAAGPVLNETPSLGLSSGTAAQLSQNEFDAFRRRLEECWSPPPGVDRTMKLNVVLRVLFRPDGSVARPPELVSGPASQLGPAMADSARRAIMRCQPFKMLRPESYEQWKDIEINFDPQQMLRG